MRSSLLCVLALSVCAAPAFAAVTVNSPSPNTTVGNPFVLTATASPCSSQPVASMGYSLDAGATTVVNAASINAQVAAPTGNHTLHVKSWGNQGASCSTDVPIMVSSSVAATPFTDVSVSQPTGAFKLVSPFALVASGTQCKSQPITAMGYSIDDSSNTTIMNGGALSGQVTSPTGAHTLHVKAWGSQGASCVNDVAINVVPSPTSTLPSSAIAVNGIHTLINWVAEIDTATGASNTTYGATSLTSAPTLSGTARQFTTTTADNSGERYHVSFGADTAATNFLYDAWVYLGAGANNISNLEFDMNQVMANGRTVIYGFQCDSWSKTWDYTANLGTPTAPNDTWLPSTAACNVQNWSPNTWHHVQIAYSRDAGGNVTYKSVWLDNVQQDLNVTVNSAFALGWSPTLLTNFQVDGMTQASSNSTVYLDNLTVYRW